MRTMGIILIKFFEHVTKFRTFRKKTESYAFNCPSMDEKCTLKRTENKYMSKNYMNE
jgi:hypothetical protein